MINYDASPSKKPAQGGIIPKGCYKATIVKAEMRTPKSGGSDYFQAECNIVDTVSNIKSGKFWIKLFDSDNDFTRWINRRFIDALHLPIKGGYELTDLVKMCAKGKELLVDIKPQDGDNAKYSELDTSADVFYPVETLKEQESAMAEAEADAANTFEKVADEDTESAPVEDEEPTLSDY